MAGPPAVSDWWVYSMIEAGRTRRREGGTGGEKRFDDY